MKESKVKELLLTGKECLKRGELKKAQAILNEVLESGKADKDTLADAYFNLANIFHMRGEIGKAIKAFNKVLSLDSNHTDASISLSVLYNDIGHYEEAKKIFDKANERVKAPKGEREGVEDNHLNAKFSSKHYELAEMYMTYNRHDEALFEYNKALKLNPSNLEIRVKIAKIYAKKNFISKAFDELKVLKNEHPEFIQGRVALGVLYYGNGKILEAQNEWEKVLSRDPKNSEAQMYINLSRTATETSLS